MLAIINIGSVVVKCKKRNATIITIYNATLTEAPLGRDASFAIIIRVIMK